MGEIVVGVMSGATVLGTTVAGGTAVVEGGRAVVTAAGVVLVAEYDPVLTVATCWDLILEKVCSTSVFN
jgi:hypothetical protein